MSRRLVLALALVGLTLAQSAGTAAPLTPGFEWTTNGVIRNDGSYTMGYQFHVNTPISVVALGIFTNGGDVPFSADAGLWLLDGTLLGYTTIAPGDYVQGHFQYDFITPVALGVGDYRVGARIATGQQFVFNSSGITVNPDISAGKAVFAVGGTGQTASFPSMVAFDTDGTDGNNGYFGGNFLTGDAVPEPASLVLTGIGLLGLARRGWRRRQTATK